MRELNMCTPYKRKDADVSSYISNETANNNTNFNALFKSNIKEWCSDHAMMEYEINVKAI